MKKYTVIISFLFLCLLANCSKSDEGPNNGIDKSANLLATGASANDILSNNTYSKLLIEIAYVQNFRPTQEAMDDFETYLRDRTFKQDIEVTYLQLPSPNEEDLSLQEIATLEDENRTAYNEGETLAIYIYFADVPAEGDDMEQGLVTLGSVYRNTSMVIYESTVLELVAQSSIVTLAEVETTTLEHEFGHLFGLVNLGSPMVNDHEDPASGNHCDIPGCLMRAELQFGGGMMSMLEKQVSKGAVVPLLDAECILDLQANGGR